ncbi:hypothetical protein [Treponema sp. Marseille-Q3903]|jgi:hypothetical protein|uniref:hypothetical protein n=1 Tax=Treponema sp. Marseille-Q3903 TaxID=2766703 RepID=UPI0016522489|nr:hypothetical protein [Treponema sp. Marseille-Q3903]MBC6712581.1 hypothetical protein [Treponema sp. Marseille-Q3903]
MAINKKIKVKDEDDKTLYEVKLDDKNDKKPNHLLRFLLLVIIIPLGVFIGYILSRVL